MKVDARALLGREIRPSRLLESPRLSTANRDMILEETMHTRPATLLIRLLGDYEDTALWIRRADGRRQKCTTSIISLLALALRKDEAVTFEAEGRGACEMLDRLEKINAGGWLRWETEASVIAPSTGDLTLEGVLKCVENAMQRFGIADLCGVLDPESGRIYLGRPEWGHGGTALVADLKHVTDYGRINFTRTDTGKSAPIFRKTFRLRISAGI
jgi:phosphotransferase system HPr (HPr) family protein